MNAAGRSSLVTLVMLAIGCACGGGGKEPSIPPTTPTGAGAGSATDTGSGSAAAGAPLVLGPTSDEAVLEAVFLHEIAAAQTGTTVLCLRVRPGGDASDALLAAIQRRHPTAMKGSACGGGGPTPVIVTLTGAPGIVFDIGPVLWGPDAALVVGGGGHRGGSSGILETEYRVELKDGAFAVVSERVLRQN